MRRGCENYEWDSVVSDLGRMLVNGDREATGGTWLLGPSPSSRPCVLPSALFMAIDITESGGRRTTTDG